MASGLTTLPLKAATDIASCKKCSGWEKWGKVPEKIEVAAKQSEELPSKLNITAWESFGKVLKKRETPQHAEGGTAQDESEEHVDDISATTGTPRKDECASEVPTSTAVSPQFTPRMTPRESEDKEEPKAPTSALAKNRRRSSRVSFVENFGFNADSDEEMESFEDIIRESMVDSFAMATPRVQEEDACDTEGPADISVNLEDSDNSDNDNSDSDDGDIYDEYDFDHTKIAEMVQLGADREKVTCAFEEAMAAALERKLQAKTAAPKKDLVSIDNPFATGAARPGEEIYNDLSGNMTPGRMTPTEDAATAEAAVAAKDVASRMQQAMESAKLRRRRSSAAKKGVDVIQEAKQMAAMKRRASLAARSEGVRSAMSAEGGDAVQDTISEAMKNAHRRHRQSISKAADVLEDAGVDNCQVGEVATKMSMIEVAMSEARRRHRRSIAKAVEQLQDPPAATPGTYATAFNPTAAVFVPPSATFNTSAEVFVPPSAPVYSGNCQQTAGDWDQQQTWNLQCQQGSAVPSHQQQQETVSWNGQCQQSWEPSPFQSRINQAMNSAYQSHCYTEEQTYANYDGSGAYYDGSGCGAVAANGCYTQSQDMQCSPQGFSQVQQSFVGQDGGNYQNNYCNQPTSMQGQCSMDNSQSGWNTQAGNGAYFPPGGMHAQQQFAASTHNSMTTMHTQCTDQYNAQLGGNQYCQDGYNQGASWQSTPNSWGGNDGSACGGYANYQ